MSLQSLQELTFSNFYKASKVIKTQIIFKKIDISPGNLSSFLDRGGVEVTEDEIQQVTVFQHLDSAGDDVGRIQGSHNGQFLL